MRLVRGVQRRLWVLLVVFAAGGVFATPAFAGAPTVTWDSPAGGFVSPSTDFIATAVPADTGVGAVQFEYSTAQTGPWQVFATIPGGVHGPNDDYHAAWNTQLPAEGPYYVRAEAFDTTSPTPLSSATGPVSVTLDTTPPAIAVTCTSQSGQPGPCGWYQSSVAPIQVCASVTDAGSGPGTLTYSDDGGSTTNPYTSCFGSYSTDTTIVFTAVDAAGNTTTKTVHIGFDDSPPPAPTLTLDPSSVGAYLQQQGGGYTVWFRYTTDGSAVLHVPATDDPESGVASAAFGGLDYGGWSQSSVDPLTEKFTWTPSPTIPTQGIDVTSTNGAGATGSASQVSFVNDTFGPTGTPVCAESNCTNPNGPVHVSLDANDTGSGIKEIRYTIDGTDPSASTGTVGSSVTITTPNTTVKFWAVDNVGNEMPVVQTTVGQASSLPTVQITSAPTEPTSFATIGWSSSSSGVTYQCRLKTADWIPFATCGTSISYGAQVEGTYTFEVRAVDGAGNPGPVASTQFTLAYAASMPSSLSRVVGANADSITPALSATGEGLAYATYGSGILSYDTNQVRDVYEHDLLQGGTGGVSVQGGEVPDAASGEPAMSADGRFVAFSSPAGNIVSGSTAGTSQIYVYDKVTQTTQLVSRASDGTVGDGDSTQPALSADGRYVVWTSASTNLGANSGGFTQIYRRDLATGTTTLMSVSYDDGVSGCDDSSQYPSISGDGNLVAFQTAADNCVTNFSNGSDVVVRDVSADTTELANLNADNTEVPVTTRPALSGDGRFLAFADDNTGSVDVRDLQAGTTAQISGSLPAATSPAISDDGGTVAFVSTPLLDAPSQVYVETGGGTPTLVSANSDGLGGNGASADPAVSADGTYLAFDSAASDISGSDTNNATDIFMAPTGAAAPPPADETQVGPTYTVNSAADPGDGTCTLNDCTLREAIAAANAGDVAATIDFAIGVGGAQTIPLASGLPALSKPTTIDGTTQPGFLGPPLITVDGAQAGVADGIRILASNCTIRGLDLVDFHAVEGSSGIGIHVLGGGGDVITGNYSGILADGVTAAGNAGDGIRIEGATHVTVGGPTPAERNVVGGNSGHGIFLADSTDSLVQGNYSGLDAAGANAIGNGIDGIAVDSGGSNAIVGNVSSGNAHQGISIFNVSYPVTATDVTVIGNKTGTDAFGDATIPNGGDGILVASGSGHVVGRTDGGENLSRGNDGNGVRVVNATGTVVAANTISDNGGAGVLIEATAPNTSVSSRNTITGNGGAGVSVFSSGNAILGNSIGANGGPGIDLNGVGNALQSSPLVAAVRSSGGTLSVVGKFLSPGGTYRIEYFLSSECGPEGETFIGSSQAVVNAGGEIALTAQLNAPQPLPGTYLTATATSAANNTSAFSKCIQVTVGGTATSATLSFGADTQTTLPGAAAVPLADIPSSAFGKVTYDSNGNPLPPPIGLGSIGLGSIGLGSIGLGSIDLASSGLGSIGLGSIGLTDATLVENGLGGIPLNTLPLLPPGSWEALLSSTPLGGVPIQTLTVKDVLDEAPSTLAGIGLGSIDLSHSGLGSIGLGSIALGSIGLGSIPLDSNASNTTQQNLDQWCTFIHAQPGFSSYNCSTLAAETVLGLALQGVPVASGLGSIGLGSIDLSGTGLGSIGLGSIDLADSGLGSIGLGSIGLGSIGLGSIGLGSIDLGATGLGSIGLGSIGLGSIGNIVDCTITNIDCSSTTQTLADAFAAGALKSTATLSDLLPYFQAHPSEFTLADLASYFQAHPNEFTLSDLLPGLPPDVTVDDLLSALIGGAAPQDWENTPLEGLAAFAGAPGASGGMVTYTAGFTIQGTGTALATLTVTPPSGAYYVPGSATLAAGDAQTTLGDPFRGSDGTLQWPLSSLDYGTAYTFSFRLRPGLRLGPEQTTVALSTNGIDDLSKQASVTVTDTNEPNDGAITPAPPAIAPDTLYLSYLGNGRDVDYYKLHVDPDKAPAGTRIRIVLSHLHSDDDLAVYGPGESALRGSGLGSIGLGSIGLGSIAPGEQQVETGEASQPLQSDPAQDLPASALPSGDQLVGVSDNRGTVTDEVDITSTGLAQDLIVQVSSYDGNPTTDPYLLRVENDKPPALPPCGQSAPPAGGTTEATLPTNASIPSTAQTLILFNEKRLAQYYGQTDASAVYSHLVAYAGQSTVHGVIVPVEADAGVAQAYAAWDQNLCSPAAANGVVKAIGTLLDALTANHPNLTSIVVVGADNVIPFARLLDTTQQANEVGFRSNFGYVNNEYVGAVAAGYLFSDDPYGDPAPRQFGAGFLYTPKYALGRLVEKPSEIDKQLDYYDNVAHGVITPTTKLVSGYDFLTDGAQAVDAALPGADTAGDLISDNWTADMLRTDLFALSAPTIDSLNAHYDQHQALSAAGNTAHDESAPYLFTTSDVPADSVVGRVVFTMGCHAGFSLFDNLPYVPSPASNPPGFTQDWPQTYMAGGAIAFMGNTGYGLGDTTAVAYSERLDQLFAQRLTTMTIGQALAYAKQEYFGDLGIVSAYDQKVANEATFYGLPTYRLGTGTPPSAPAALPTHSDPVTGLTAADFNTQPQFQLNTSPVTNGGSYYSVTNDPNGLGIQVTNRRPIEPLTSLDVTESGTTAHGVLITSLASQDHSPFQVSFGRVAVANSTIEPQLTGIADFPAQIQSLVNVATPNGPRQRAVLIAGHFASGSAGNIGAQRNYTAIGGTVLYSTSQDFVRPTITNMQVLQAGSTVGFAADVSDLDAGGQAGTVKEAIVLYLDGSGVWQRVNLSCANGRCSGGGPLTGTTVDYIAEAVDAAGNVGINANKAAARDVTPATGSGHISLTIDPGTTTAGWVTASGTATVSSDDGASLSTSLDGAPYQPLTTVPVSGDGLHVLDVRGSDGSSATFAIPIDTLPPTIAIYVPADGSYLLNGDIVNALYSCADAGSGLASSGGCVGPVASGSPIDATAGTKTFTVNAKDAVGHTSAKSVTYQVWQWSGFLNPINNPPTLNVAKAGSAIPVKFSLGGNRGLNFLAATSPASRSVACDTGAPLDTVEQTVTAGSSSLQYDSTSNQYTYVWKTQSSWSGTCRELTLTFTNGDVRKAEFKFR